MEQIQLLEEPEILIFEGFPIPPHLGPMVEMHIARLPIIENSLLNKFIKENRRFYQIYKRLSEESASATLLNSLLDALSFARDDGELDFRCSYIDDLFLFRCLTGYRMKGEDTGWLFSDHIAIKANDGYYLLLPRD